MYTDYFTLSDNEYLGSMSCDDHLSYCHVIAVMISSHDITLTQTEKNRDFGLLIINGQSASERSYEQIINTTLLGSAALFWYGSLILTERGMNIRILDNRLMSTEH